MRPDAPPPRPGTGAGSRITAQGDRREDTLRLLDERVRYTPQLQAERRAFVRRQAAIAAAKLQFAAGNDDPDVLVGAVCSASAALGAAMVEILRAHLG